MKKEFYIIAAADEKNGVGKDGVMPWHFTGEMKHFKDVTTTTKNPDKWNMVIMGSTTWASLPEKYRPLVDRRNIVLVRYDDFKAEGAELAFSLDEAFGLADDNVEKIFIIGGASVYAQTVVLPNVAGIYLTRIKKTYDCDTFFPKIPKKFSKVESLGKVEENGIEYEFLLYKKP